MARTYYSAWDTSTGNVTWWSSSTLQPYWQQYVAPVVVRLSSRLEGLSRIARSRIELAQFVTLAPEPGAPAGALRARRLRGRASARAVRRRFASPQRRVLAFSR